MCFAGSKGAVTWGVRACFEAAGAAARASACCEAMGAASRARAGSGAATDHRGGVARFESSPIAPESFAEDAKQEKMQTTNVVLEPKLGSAEALYYEDLAPAASTTCERSHP